MSKLTYSDKTNPVAIVNRPTQATAEDFNEIKASANALYDGENDNVSEEVIPVKVGSNFIDSPLSHDVSDGVVRSSVPIEVPIVQDLDQIKFDPTTALAAYVEGQFMYDPITGSHVADTGFTDVRTCVGRESHILVYNDTGVEIGNGTAVSATGESVGAIPKVIPTTSTNILIVLGFVGVATMNIPTGTSGLVTRAGLVHGVNTGSLTTGFIYVDSLGDYTHDRPRYPEFRLVIGGVVQTGASDGIIYVSPKYIPRRAASRSYTFTSADALAGTHYRAGFYDWSSSSVTLTQASLSVTHGAANITRAAHIGIVASAPGTVNTGQVGLQVTGTLDSETDIQLAGQTKIITDDITTLTADQMIETVEKFSGNVEISLYTAVGSPTAYSVSINYGYSKYEDISNIDGTVTALDVAWEAGATDTVFNIQLKHHRADGWIYAATGFVAGNGNICERLVDQGVASNLAAGESGAYKRTGLDTFIQSSGPEGIILEITTGSNNSIRSMDIHVTAFSEELF